MGAPVPLAFQRRNQRMQEKLKTHRLLVRYELGDDAVRKRYLMVKKPVPDTLYANIAANQQGGVATAMQAETPQSAARESAGRKWKLSSFMKTARRLLETSVAGALAYSCNYAPKQDEWFSAKLVSILIGVMAICGVIEMVVGHVKNSKKPKDDKIS